MRRLWSVALLTGCIVVSGCVVLTDPGSFEGGDGGITPDGMVGDATDAGPDTFSACPTACTGATPVCNETTMECVQCVLPADCAGEGVRAMCADGSCVECTDSSECTSPEAPVCASEGVEAGTCVPCTAGSASDCAGIVEGATALSVCVERAGSGVCVECTEASAADDCGDFSCNPATNACTETERGTVLDCGRCVGDSECNAGAGFRRVPMMFGGAPRPDGYCLKRASEGCERPYLSFVVGESLSGEDEAMYCGIDQATTTCDAVRALRESRECRDGEVALCADVGARCEMVGAAANRCTIPCSTADECLLTGPTSTCAADYCGS